MHTKTNNTKEPKMSILNKLQEGAIAIECALMNPSSIKSQKGVTMIEYALIAALVAVVAITALTAVGSKLDTVFSYVSGKLTT
jgi:pilus assembly protein Flp/PilA